MTSFIFSMRTSTIIKTSIWLIISLAIAGCDNSNDSATTAEQQLSQEIIQLNDQNIVAFSQQLIDDYSVMTDSLLINFKQFRSEKNSFAFSRYRNHQWTPLYIEKKDFYQQVFKHNQSYIESSSMKPLFTRFDMLIYIGLDLKNGFLNDDSALIMAALKDIKTAQKVIANIQKQYLIE